jgi:hypothetical protein
MSCDSSNDSAVRVDGAPDYEFLSAMQPVSEPESADAVDNDANSDHAEASGESDDDSDLEAVGSGAPGSDESDEDEGDE